MTAQADPGAGGISRAKGAAPSGGTRLTANDVQNGANPIFAYFDATWFLKQFSSEDLEYVVPVSLGAPGQTVHLDFDTVSCLLPFFHVACSKLRFG